jgi:branched-chain amino acid transport system substrate-binding protein
MNKKCFPMFSLIITLTFVLSSSVFAQVKDKDYVQGVTKDEILIGSTWAMTGTYALAGIGQYEATDLYFNEVNAKGGVLGRKIKSIAEDDGCTPMKGVGAIQKVLAEKPFMLYGPTCSGVGLAYLETIVKEGIPWVAAGLSTPKVFIPMRHNIFRTGGVPDNLQAMMSVDYDINYLKARKIAIIYDTTEYGKGGKDGIVDRLAEYGLKPVAVESYNNGDTDFTTQILKVREAKPEVVHLYSYVKEGIILVRQAKEFGLDAKIIISAAANNPAFLEAAGDAAVGVRIFHQTPYLIDSPEPLVADFVKRLKANYRVGAGRPSQAELQGIGGAVVVVEGLKRAGKDLTWEKYITALESMKNFECGFITPTTFSPTDHNGTKTGKFLIIQPGKKWAILPEELTIKENVQKLQ